MKVLEFLAPAIFAIIFLCMAYYLGHLAARKEQEECEYFEIEVKEPTPEGKTEVKPQAKPQAKSKPKEEISEIEKRRRFVENSRINHFYD